MGKHFKVNYIIDSPYSGFFNTGPSYILANLYVKIKPLLRFLFSIAYKLCAKKAEPSYILDCT